MKQNIALIYGGNSSEVEISTLSGLNISSLFNRDLFNVYNILLRGQSWRVLNPSGEQVSKDIALNYLRTILECEKSNNIIPGSLEPSMIECSTGVEIDKNDFSFTYNNNKIKFYSAYIVVHGTPGENGMLQGYLEMLNIPYNTCSSLVSAITFDKYSCKRFLDNAGVKMAKDIYLNKGTEYSNKEIIDKLGLPIFVKPTQGGSSFGITKVKSIEELEPAIELAFSEYDTIVIEESIDGREFTNGICKTKSGEIIEFPVTEIVTEREFFDYEAKYEGDSKEICPANISGTLTKEIQQLSSKIYNYLGCKGLVRLDYIIKGDEIYFLEINNVPGMTNMSLIPQQARVAGIDISELISATI